MGLNYILKQADQLWFINERNQRKFVKSRIFNIETKFPEKLMKTFKNEIFTKVTIHFKL